MIENFLEKRKLILTFLFFFIFFGLQKYISLPKESDPDISIPVIYVSLAHKGISPDDSERLLIKPMEKELKNIVVTEETTTVKGDNGFNKTKKVQKNTVSKKTKKKDTKKISLSELAGEVLYEFLSLLNIFSLNFR